MRLTELEPEFVVLTENGYRHVPTIVEAQGLMFLCPSCFAKNNGPIGTHMVLCWSRSRGVPDNVTPGPGRWMLVGTSFEDLTLDGDPPGNPSSVNLGAGEWHGHIKNGEIS